jgi:hypothetical protein
MKWFRDAPVCDENNAAPAMEFCLIQLCFAPVKIPITENVYLI